MKIEVYDDITEDSAGTDVWRYIEKSSEEFSPFKRLVWARSWLASYSNVSSTCILVARDDGGAMILPLMEYDGVLRTLCYNAADVTGSIWFGDLSRLSLCVADYLARTPRFNELLLWNVLSSDPLVQVLKKMNHLEFVGSVSAHVLDIDSIRTDPLAWLNASQTRKQAKRDLRRLVRDGAALRCRVSPKDVDLDALMDVHDREWRAKGTNGKFVDPRRRNFVKRLAAAGFPMFLSTLTLGKTILAYNMLFYSEKTVSLWNSGYDMDFKRLGPGSALLVADIMDIASATGVVSYDFLRGDEKYKRSYANQRYEIDTYKIK